ALGVYVATGVVVGQLASSSRARAEEAEQRQRESSFLANASAALLGPERVADRLKGIAAGAGEVLGLRDPRLELGSLRRPDRAEARALDGGRADRPRARNARAGRRPRDRDADVRSRCRVGGCGPTRARAREPR